MKWSVGGVYGHYDVNVFCGQGMENHLSKVQRSILHRPSAVVDVEILSNPFLEMGRVCGFSCCARFGQQCPKFG